MSLLDRGKHEGLKGAVHATVLAGCAVSAGYNIACFIKRPKFYLFVNALLYSAVVGYEIATVKRHWGNDGE